MITLVFVIVTLSNGSVDATINTTEATVFPVQIKLIHPASQAQSTTVEALFSVLVVQQYVGIARHKAVSLVCVTLNHRPRSSCTLACCGNPPHIARNACRLTVSYHLPPFRSVVVSI